MGGEDRGRAGRMDGEGRGKAGRAGAGRCEAGTNRGQAGAAANLRNVAANTVMCRLGAVRIPSSFVRARTAQKVTICCFSFCL